MAISIDDIREGDDPARIIVELDRQLRPSLLELDSLNAVPRVQAYSSTIAYAAKKLSVDLNLHIPADLSFDDARQLYYDLGVAIDKLRIDLVTDRRSEEAGVPLDPDWRSKIHSYLSIIRKIVEQADIAVEIRDSIISRLHDLDKEVDRVRTRVKKFSDAIVGICEAISTGAEALKPAVRLFEKIIGALARLQRAELPTALPPPETLGLPDYSDKVNERKDSAT